MEQIDNNQIITKTINLKLDMKTYSLLRRLQEELGAKGIKTTLPETIEGCIKSTHEKGINNTSYWTK